MENGVIDMLILLGVLIAIAPFAVLIGRSGGPAAASASAAKSRRVRWP